MHTLTFKLDDRLRQVIDHAAAHDPVPHYGQAIGRSLYFVKDQGAYLMSAGVPGLLDPSAPAFATRQLVQYAEGHDPDSAAYDYDHTRLVCGGDDFAEPLDVEFFVKASASGAKTITIRLTDDQISLEAL